MLSLLDPDFYSLDRLGFHLLILSFVWPITIPTITVCAAMGYVNAQWWTLWMLVVAYVSNAILTAGYISASVQGAEAMAFMAYDKQLLLLVLVSYVFGQVLKLLRNTVVSLRTA